MVSDLRNDPNPFALLIPASDLFAGGDVCLKIPRRIIPHILGMMAPLTDGAVWKGTNAQRALVVRQMETFLATLGTVESLCDETPPSENGTGENGEIITFVACDECMEDCTMACGGINPAWFREGPDGHLQVFYCGEWFNIADGGLIIGNGDNTITDGVDPDQNEFSACGKAHAIADLLCSVMEDCWEASFGSPFNWVGSVTAQWPNIEFGEYDLFNVILEISHLRGVLISIFIEIGVTGWTEDMVIPDTLRDDYTCFLLPSMDDTPDIDADYLFDLLDTMTRTIGPAPSDGTRRGFLYNRLITAIGKNDLAKYARLGALDTDTECPCEGGIGGTFLGPTASGWYLSAPMTFTVACPGGFDFGRAVFYQQASHDVYGTMFEYAYVSGAPINKLKRANECTQATDVCFNTGNSDSQAVATQYFQCGANAYSEVSALVSNPSHAPLASLWSDVIATPFGDAGELIEQDLLGQAQGDPANTVVRFTLRWLHNTNSPSHS